MRVKITGFTGMELWYRCKIGETFEVENSMTDGWYRVKDSNKHIKVDDATPIRETGLIGSEGERLAEELYQCCGETDVHDLRAAFIAGYEKGREHHAEMLEMLKRIKRHPRTDNKLDLEIQSLITKIETNAAKP